METYRRMIVKDLDNGSDYMVLKPDGDDFHKVGRHYSKRGLFNYLKNLKWESVYDDFPIEIIVDASLLRDVDTFTDIGELVETLRLEQGVKTV